MATKFKQNMEVTGRVTATQFQGDGSLLTGISGANFGGDITEVIAGVGLEGGGTSGSVTLDIDVGIGANDIVQLDGSGRLPAVDGSQLINLPGGGGGGASDLNGLTDVSTAGVTTGQVLKYNGASWAPAADSVASGGSLGDITVTGSTLASSGTTITLDDDVTVTGTITSSQAGAPIITSASTLTLQATTRTTIANTPLKLHSFTTTARNALSAADGDMIYNSTTSKFQGLANGSWTDLAATTGPLTYSVQNLTGPGAISLTETVTNITTTGADAYTLADGNIGQLKVICMVGNGGDGTLTPDNLVGWTSVKFDNVNNTLTMIYTSNGWAILALQNATRIS